MVVVNAKVGSGKYPVLISEDAINQLKDFCLGYSSDSIVCIVDEYFKDNNNSVYPELN